jgi:metallophosphoesterase (TIGR00282 family)
LRYGAAEPLDTVDLLFFGDIVGQAGRSGVLAYVEALAAAGQAPQLLLANAENATHGFGLSPKHYEAFNAAGFTALSGGNHSFDRKDATELFGLPEARVLRPLNLAGTPEGVGAALIDCGPLTLGLLNLMGQTFMPPCNSPWEALEATLPQLLAHTPLVVVDVHAETTAEKASLAHLAAELGASLVVGTHTHVQTADERLLAGRCGFITDLGFNGAAESVIGMQVGCALQRMKAQGRSPMEVATEGPVQINAVRATLEVTTGRCLALTRVNERLQTTLISA